MISFCVRHPVATFMIYAAVVLLGLVSIGRLRVSLFPDIVFPRLTVLTSYGNIPAEEIENLVTRPIEDAVSSVPGVTGVQSISQEGLSIVQVNLQWGSSLDSAIIHVRQKVDLARSILPQDAGRSMILKFDPSQEPILTLIARPVPGGNTRFETLRDLIERGVRPLLERTNGVAGVSVLGGHRREIQVEVSAARLFAHNLSLDQIGRAINAANYNFSAGTVRRGKKELHVRVAGGFSSVAEIQETAVSVTQNGVPILLGQLARVTDGFRQRRGSSIYNGDPAVIVLIRKEPGRNTVETAEHCREAIADINHRFQSELRLEVLHDDSISIVEALQAVALEALLGGGIAFLILLVFLHDIRAAIIVILTIPASMLGTFVLMHFSHISLNIISLGGLALGTGMLVDNSIVVLESITLVREQGMTDLRDSAVRGAHMVASSVVASSLTQGIVFLPIIFVSGIAGEIFRDLSLTVTFSVINSFLSSLSLIPVLASLRWTPLLPLTRRMDGVLAPVYLRSQALLDALHSVYSASLRRFLLRPLPVILATIAVTTVGTLLFVPLEKRLFPDIDSGIVAASIEFPEGSSLESVEQWTQKLHGDLHQSGAIRHAITHAGMDEDDLESTVKGLRKPSHTETLFFLDPRVTSGRSFVNALHQYFARTGGIRKQLRLKGDPLQAMLGDDEAIFFLDIESSDRKTARILAESARRAIADLPGVQDLRATSRPANPRIVVSLDRIRLASMGLSVQEVGSALRSAIDGQIATVYREEDREIDVRLRLDGADRLDPDALPRVPVQPGGGRTVMLASMMSEDPELARSSVLRVNQRRLERLEVSASPGHSDEVFQALIQEKARLETQNQAGQTSAEIRIARANQETMDSLHDLGLAFLLSSVLIYQLLAAQFESLVHPFTLILAIPLMLIGVSGSLLLTGNSLNINSAIGLIMLAGIVVNNAIVLYEYIRENGEHLSPMQRLEQLPAILEKSGRDRLRPILLSTLTTTLASLPLALKIGPGAEMQSSMAVVVIGGLLVSTMLTLIVFPIFYFLVERRLLRRAMRQCAKSQTASAGKGDRCA